MKFTWYKLAQDIKKDIVEPLRESMTNEQYAEVRNITWWNLPFKCNALFAVLKGLYEDCLLTEYPSLTFKWRNLAIELSVLYAMRDEILECEA